MNGPIAQDALLSLALPSSSALRPSKSRRLTSLPSVAPTVRPCARRPRARSRARDCSTPTSGWMPISAPVPTADIGCDLVKISASGPMPTSRYCDHAPCAISASLSRAASGDPGRTLDRLSPITRDDRAADALGLRRIAARLLLDHALEHARDEGDARRLDRLQVARRQQPRLRRRRAALRPNWPAPRRASRRAAARAPRASAAAGSRRFMSALDVGAMAR